MQHVLVEALVGGGYAVQTGRLDYIEMQTKRDTAKALPEKLTP